MAKIICIEGLDGAGKSTQLNNIYNYLTDEHNYRCINIHYPMYGHNSFSKLVSSFLKGEFGNNNEVDPYFIGILYAMDRYKYLDEFKDAMDEYDYIILDRYVLSNIAYQCAKYDMKNMSDESNKLKKWILDFEFNFLKLPIPDLTLFLDTPMEIIKQRLASSRGDREYLNGCDDIHEKDLELQSTVRNNYIKLILGDFKYSSDIIPTSVPRNIEDENEYMWKPKKPEDIFKDIKKSLNKHNII